MPKTSPNDPVLSKEDADWISRYATEVISEFNAAFLADGRFPDGPRVVKRFTRAVDSVLKHGLSKFSAVDEAHNELCVARALLAHSNPRITRLEYEPLLEGSSQSIDYRATVEDGSTIYVDVKTIQPKFEDRWDQFEKANQEKWFRENVNVILSKDSLGGELWHLMVAARSRMLEYALELEKKIRDAGLSGRDDARSILALCGAGFHWHESDLEDFVAFYRTGVHRGDDAFAQMEADYIQQKTITLDGTIERFACMLRNQRSVLHKSLNWNVQPPTDIPF